MIHDIAAAVLPSSLTFMDYATLAIAIFTGGLFIATVKLVRDAKHTSERQIAISSQQTTILGLQTDIATKAHALERMQFLANNRPRLRVREITVNPLVADNKVTATVVAANVGNSDATIIAVGVDIFPRLKNIGNSGTLNAAPLPRQDIPPIKIGQQVTFVVNSSTDITQDTIKRINGNSNDLCFLGIIQYVDGNGEMRLTSFFRIYDSTRKRFVHAPMDDDYAEREYED